MLWNIGRQAGIALLVVAIMVLGALSLRRQRRTLLDMEALESRGPSETVLLERLDETGQPVYASVGAGASEEEGDEEEELPTYIQSPGSATYDSLKDFATKEPEQVARVLKTWMSS